MSSKESNEPVKLIEVLHEGEAGIIISALAARGIEANSAGAATAGFRAESPGMVEIWVHQKNLEEAQRILETIKDSSSEIDWSLVDTGDSSPLTAEELNEDDAKRDT